MRKYFIVFQCCVLMLLLTACGNWKTEDKEYVSMFKFDNEYYRSGYMSTIRKPDKEVGKIDSVVESGSLPEKNNQTNLTSLNGEVLYINEAEPDDIYIYIDSPYEEYVPVYEKYIKGIWTIEDLEDGLYMESLMYQDKIYLLEFASINPATFNFNVDENSMAEAGIIDTHYGNAPHRNFSTNIVGLLGDTLYADKKDPNILYTKYRNETGEYQEGEYCKYVYKEKKKKVKK